MISLTTSTDINCLFRPRSIVVVGAGEDSPWARPLISNLAYGGYDGQLYGISSRSTVIPGVQVCRDLGEVCDVPDLAVLLVGRNSVTRLVEETAAIGIRRLMVLASGFAETGAEGRARQDSIRAMVDANGQLMLGPNSLGYLNFADGVRSWVQPVHSEPPPGGVCLVSQTGALGVSALEFAAANDIGLSHLVHVGNEAVLSAPVIAQSLLLDERVAVLALLLECIRDPDQLLALLAASLETGKPVVVAKLGRSARSARTVAAHTGGIVGDAAATRAVVEQRGGYFVESIEELLILAAYLCDAPRTSGSRTAVITGSGGATTMIVDLAEELNLELPPPSAETAKSLEAVLPDFGTVQNPLDVTGVVVGDKGLRDKAAAALVQDPAFDTLVVNRNFHQALGSDQGVIELIEFAKMLQTSPIPVSLMTYLPLPFTPELSQRRREAGLPFIAPGLRMGLWTLSTHARWSERHARRLAEVSAQFGEERGTGSSTTDEQCGEWSEFRTRKWLADNGVPFISGELATTADEAAAIASHLGYPVAVKASAAGLAHKSDIGAVRLDLTGPAQVEDAFFAVTSSVRLAYPRLEVEGALVTAMHNGAATELVVGAVRDETWGLMLAVGLGGVFVELFGSPALRQLPVRRSDVVAMLREFAGSEVLRGLRGASAVNLDALVDAVYAFARAAYRARDRLLALELNPIRVGETTLALDALVEWADDDKYLTGG